MATKGAAKGTGARTTKARKRKEPDEIDKIFGKMDVNHDGRISVRELTKAAQLIGLNPTAADAEEMIRECDPKEPGYINLKEFRALLMQKQEAIEEEETKLREAFAVFDKDGSGTISADEIRSVMRHCGGGMDDDSVEEMMRYADVDGDGMITIDEFARVMME